MIRCYITDRRQLPEPQIPNLLRKIEEAIKRGVDWIQVREKDLEARELLRLTREIVKLSRAAGGKVLVNTALEVALASGADGVHLPGDSPRPTDLRPVVPSGFLFTVACHSIGDVVTAEREGAGAALLSPVFIPRSKSTDRTPVGLDSLRAAASQVKIPVLALGGVTWTNAAECMEAGAAGVAGISLYQ